MTHFDPTYFDHSTPRTQLAPPIWPLPSLGGNAPIITGLGKRQPGVDLAYADGVEVPRFLPVLAVGNGEVQFAGAAGIIIDHKNGFSTMCAHLDHMFVVERRCASRKRRERVSVGDVLGYVSLPFHFEIWRLEDFYHYGPIDPVAHLREWAVLPWSERTASITSLPIAA